MASIVHFGPQRSFESYPVGSTLSVVGHFDWRIFENPENGYKIYTFDIEKIIDNDNSEYITSDNISVTGYYEVNEVSGKLPCKIYGTVNVYKGEKQLAAQMVEFIEPTTTEGIITFLGSGIIKGIGKKTAEKIVNGYRIRGKYLEGFGEDTLEIIKNDHLRLTSIKGISASRAQLIHDSYMENMEYQNVMLFFQKYGISSAKAMKMYNSYKGRAIEVATENPFMFLSIKGFGFKTCDEIARKMGLNTHSVYRIESGIRHSLESAELEGHCYLQKSQLLSMARENLSIHIPFSEAKRYMDSISGDNDEAIIIIDGLAYNVTREKLAARIEEAKIKGGNLRDARVVIDDISESEILEAATEMLRMRRLISCSQEESQDEAIYTWDMYNMERDTARTIKKIINSECEGILAHVDKLIEEFENLKGFQLEEMQKQAIKSVFNTNMLIMTGSAGSGKTTTVEGIIFVLKKVFGTDEEELSFMLAAPTGKAAKRLTEVTGFEAKTIHRLLQYSFDSGGFFYKQGNMLPYKLIVIDECSMLSIDLAYNLFKAIRPETKVIMIGDVQQLPPVGAGNVLNDMIKSGAISTVKLDVIKRQADGSGIITNANRIIHGEMLQSDFENKDFFIVEADDKQRVIKRALESVSRLMSAYNYLIEDIQVICPQKTSEIGTYEMNKAIQELVNPFLEDRPEIKRGNSTFRVGDKVIHLNNNYEAEHYIRSNEKYQKNGGSGVFNGDIGKIIDIIVYDDDDEEEFEHIGTVVAVQYDEFIILYERQELEEIDLAYSLTVHKMQGSQCEAAVFLCHMRNFGMLSRNLGYTALTRARKMACIIGQSRAISVMVQNVRVTQRNTMLDRILSSMNEGICERLVGDRDD